MALLNRETLRKLFGKGSRPTEAHFADLIDSMINKVDDGFAKSPDGGLGLAPAEGESRVLSYYARAKDRHAEWHTGLNPEPGVRGLDFSEAGGRSALFLRRGGQVGVGTQNPQHQLEVDGMMGMAGREGTFASGQVPADGFWHPVLTGLNDLQAFEVVAQVNRPARKAGRPVRSTLLHATAMSTFGGIGSHHKIRKTQFGWYWDRIGLRWAGDTFNYELQMRTYTNYGKDAFLNQIMINYRICRLWGEDHPQPSLLPGAKP